MHNNPRSTSNDARTERILSRGVWALPIFALLLGLGTLTHQPDYNTDFAGYAGYVTTGVFLVSHLVASIGGAVFGVIGIVSAAFLLIQYGARPGRTLLAAALGVAGNVVNTAIFGVAAFAQPAIGRAFEAGDESVVALNTDVYGPALVGTVLTGLVMFMAGGVMLGMAMSRVDRDLRWIGVVYAVSLPVFVVAGFSIQILQPVAAAVLTVATVFLALRLRRGSEGATVPEPGSAIAGQERPA